MSENNFVSVKEYFEKGTFVIPYYQRGFKWSLLENDDGCTHLEQLLIDLVKAFNDNPDTDYHLQGITVKNKDNKIELVDGQQRTTSLFLILLYAYIEKIFAKNEFFKKYLNLDYAIRKEVNCWIENKKNDGTYTCKEDIQDIAAFNKAWEQIDEKLQDEKLKDKKEDFFNYILNKVKLIYIVLNTEPTKVFSMMNKEKATMSKTELVKSHLLSEASRQAFADLDTNKNENNEWQINHLRSHFAREWDSWLKWWNNKENRFLLNISILKIKDETKDKTKDEPDISRLLRLYYYINSPTENKNDLTKQNLFTKYCELIDDKDKKTGNKRIEAVETFEGLRLLQNVIEEWHDDPIIYNYIGMLCRSSINKFETIKYLIDKYKNDKNKFKEILKGIANWSLIPNVKIEDLKSIYENNDITNKLKENRQTEKVHLSSEIVYGSFNNSALKQLLRMNIEELGEEKKINFDIFDEQTLEHIQPKSKVITKDSKIYTSDDPINKDTEEYKEEKSPEGYLDFRCTNEISEHCIGNLVLLEGYKNSSVGTKTLNEKKKILFDKIKNGTLLLHTIKIFTKAFEETTQNESWTIEDIKTNKKYFEQKFNNCYKLKGE